MKYNYATERDKVFSEDGVRALFAIEERIRTQCEGSGCITVGKALDAHCGDSWTLFACVHFLQELGYITVHSMGGAAQDDIIKWTQRRR